MEGFSHLGFPSIKARSAPAFPEPLCGPGPPSSLLGQWSCQPREEQVWGQGSHLQPWVGVGATQQVEIGGQVAKLGPCPSSGPPGGREQRHWRTGAWLQPPLTSTQVLGAHFSPCPGTPRWACLAESWPRSREEKWSSCDGPSPAQPHLRCSFLAGGCPTVSPTLPLLGAGVWGSPQVTSAALMDQMPRH